MSQLKVWPGYCGRVNTRNLWHWKLQFLCVYTRNEIDSSDVCWSLVSPELSNVSNLPYWLLGKHQKKIQKLYLELRFQNPKRSYRVRDQSYSQVVTRILPDPNPAGGQVRYGLDQDASWTGQDWRTPRFKLQCRVHSMEEDDPASKQHKDQCASCSGEGRQPDCCWLAWREASLQHGQQVQWEQDLQNREGLLAL